MREVLPIDEEARKVIYGDRESTYGHPSKNLQLIADFWTSYLGLKETLTYDDVCNMMILMKTARLKNMPDHRDSLVDTIGYTLLKERCREVIDPVKESTSRMELVEPMAGLKQEIDRQVITDKYEIKELNKP